jgi:hypothetical protein
LRSRFATIISAAILVGGLALARPKLPGQGEPCGARNRCAGKLSCIHYRGVAGERGPELSSCELRCSPSGKCPAGQQCISIADGPGRVCRPPDKTDVPPGRPQSEGAE